MPLKTQRDDQIAINMTPMIDIVFLLIIFFMVGTKFSEIDQQERDISLSVPQVSDAEPLVNSPEKRIINVFQDGSIALDNERISLSALQATLIDAKAQYPATGVVVRGDAQSLYQHVAEVIDSCRKAKIEDLNIAVRPVEIR
ncbi:MAG: biopolymer transporter ExbD [Pirellulaceae bacterium]